MLDSKPKVPDALKGDEAKRTTIILERSEREFIEALIREGKEPGIKPLISKMLDIYKSLNVDDWHFPGEYYCGISRIAIVNVELINIFAHTYPKRKCMNLAYEWAMHSKYLYNHHWPRDAKKESWDAVFQTPKAFRASVIFLKRQIPAHQKACHQRLRNLEGYARRLT
jgi:hypothetical protein